MTGAYPVGPGGRAPARVGEGRGSQWQLLVLEFRAYKEFRLYQECKFVKVQDEHVVNSSASQGGLGFRGVCRYCAGCFALDCGQWL